MVVSPAYRGGEKATRAPLSFACTVVIAGAPGVAPLGASNRVTPMGAGSESSKSEKLPPTTNTPSAGIASEVGYFVKPIPGSRLVSRDPSVRSRAMPLRVAPPTVLKLPTSTIRPSLCIAMSSTAPPSGEPPPGRKFRSTVPSPLTRTRLFRAEES